MKYWNLIKIIPIVAMLSACAVTSKQRFPEFVQAAKTNKNIDVLVDVMVYSDIEGDDVGINPEKNRNALDKAVTAADKALRAKGFEPNFVFKGSGLFFKAKEDANYVLTDTKEVKEENDESDFNQSQDSTYEAVEEYSANKPFLGPQSLGYIGEWSAPETSSFLQSFFQAAKLMNTQQDNEEAKQKQITSFSSDQIPQVIKQGSAPMLVVMQASVGEVSGGKTAGSAILTGLLTGILSGGAYIYSSAPVSGHTADLAVLNTRTGKIMWQDSRRVNGGIKSIKLGVTGVVNAMPGPNYKEED